MQAAHQNKGVAAAVAAVGGQKALLRSLLRGSAVLSHDVRGSIVHHLDQARDVPTTVAVARTGDTHLDYFLRLGGPMQLVANTTAPVLPEVSSVCFALSLNANSSFPNKLASKAHAMLQGRLPLAGLRLPHRQAGSTRVSVTAPKALLNAADARPSLKTVHARGAWLIACILQQARGAQALTDLLTPDLVLQKMRLSVGDPDMMASLALLLQALARHASASGGLHGADRQHATDVRCVGCLFVCHKAPAL